MQDHTVSNIADSDVYSDFSYSKYVWMLHGVVERVCLPAGSTVTHDFAGWRFESRRFARVREQTPTTWNLLVNHRRRVDHYHPRWKQIFLSPSLTRRPSCTERRAHAFDDTGRYQVCLEKSSPTGLPVRCLSREQHGKPAFDRKPWRSIELWQEKYRGKMARELDRILVFLGNDAHRSAMLIVRDHQWDSCSCHNCFN